MKINKNKIILGVFIVVILAVSFWWGGNAPGLQGFEKKDDTQISTESTNEKTLSESESTKSNETTGPDEIESTETDESIASVDKGDKESKEANIKSSPKIQETSKPKEDLKPPISKKLSSQEKINLATEMAKGASVPEEGDVNYSTLQGMKIDKGTGKDKYLTEPVPAGKPVPIEPQNVVISDKKMTCELSVGCDTILENIDWLDPEKVELVPKDGVIFAKQTVTFYEGESVFNVLLREMKKNKIHMEFVNTPIYNSAYIEGINNLYEFDCGELSGWMYKVNGWFPNYGSSRYQLRQGDIVEWVYTCNLGVDVGGFSEGGFDNE